jgi:hypothetical protein
MESMEFQCSTGFHLIPKWIPAFHWIPKWIPVKFVWDGGPNPVEFHGIPSFHWIPAGCVCECQVLGWAGIVRHPNESKHAFYFNGPNGSVLPK